MFARALVLAVLMTSGCSYAFIQRPPRAVRPMDRMPPPDCTTSKTFPVLDAVLAIGGVAGGIGIYSGAIKDENMDTGERRELTGNEKALLGSISIVEGLLFAWSSVHGFRQTQACRDMQAWLQREPVYIMPQTVPP